MDTFRGLPVHILVVHAVVVGVPLMSLVSAVVALRPGWRAKAAWPVVAANALLAVVTFVAKESGEKLRVRVGDSPAVHQHAERGDKMLWFVLALLVASLLVALAQRRGDARLSWVAAGLVVLAAVAAIGWVTYTGEAGSSAVWRDLIAHTGGG